MWNNKISDIGFINKRTSQIGINMYKIKNFVFYKLFVKII